MQNQYYYTGAQSFGRARFGEGIGPVLLDDVQCNGDELRLEDCAHNGFTNSNCGHNEDAGVRCIPTTPPPTTTETPTPPPTTATPPPR